MSVVGAFMVPHPPMIVPEVGRGSEERVRATINAYEKAAECIAELEPETIIITSPHATMYSNYFHISPGRGAKGDFGDFRAKSVAFDETYDEELVQAIDEIAMVEEFPAGTEGEKKKALDHGTMVPLWFIRRKYTKGKIVRIGLSGLPLTEHYRLGMIIKRAVEDLDRRVVFVASGDLSHKLQDYGPYGFAPEGPVYDERIMDVAGRAAFGEMLDFSEDFCDKAAECGHRSFVIMAGALDGVNVEATKLSHEDVTGVGYGICTFYPKGEEEARHFLDRFIEKLEAERAQSDEYVRLARLTIESFINDHNRIAIPDWVPQEMHDTKAGAFISIHKGGQLRGCIGTIAPTASCVALEIINNAISASTRDPRFDPIEPGELPYLEINVDVLGEPEDIDSMDQLDVKRYGVIVASGYKRGLLLPDLEGVDTVEQQVEIAMRKGRISEDDNYSLQRFEVIRHT